MTLTGKRRLSLLLLALAALAIACVAACGGDSEPAPTPTATQPPPTDPATPIPSPTPAPTPTPTLAPATPTPTPTLAPATPTPTPTPAPATATPTPAPAPATATPEAVAPAGSMRGFVIDQSTTGKDLFDRLSEEEVGCIKTVVGDSVFQIVRVTPLLAAGGDPAAAAPIFGCMTQENVVLVGAAFLDAAAGGRSEESRQCAIDLSLKHPDIIYARLGLEWTGEQVTDPAETHTVLLAFVDCLTDREKAAFLLEIFGAVDALSPITGADLIALLPESEAACVQDTLPEADYEAMKAATPLAAAAIGVGAANCLTVESVAAFTVAATAAALGGLSDESSTCVRAFTVANPTFLQVVAVHLIDPSTLTPEQFAATAGGGFEMLDCLNEDELAAINDVVAALATQ